MAFINFCFAMACFLIRYSSVFWYTNKPLTVIFALQLLAMTMNSIFSFNSFSVLYCVCYNKKIYPNVYLSLSCALDLFLYFSGSTIVLLSTMTVFEYGCHYFHEKFKVVERHHHPESYVKQTVIVNGGYQGYAPHSCAMAALILLAVCTGPLLFDLVSLMRVTDDQLLLSGIVCEVSYMVMWVALWFGLTIKQQWQFRILDYVPLRQPFHAIPGENMTKYSFTGHGDTAQSDGQNRGRQLSGRDFPGRYLESAPTGTTSSSDDQCHSDIGTDESDVLNIVNYAAEIVLDLDNNYASDSNSSFRRSRSRRNGGQRVTFDESARNKGLTDRENQHTPTNSLTRQGIVCGPRLEDTNHFNVTADVHNSTSSTNSSNESTQDVIILRKKLTYVDKPNNVDNSEYANSIRSKCGEFYCSANNLSSNFEEMFVTSDSPEPLPTLMSSFRDKVRESSLAASTFKDRERHMLEHFDYPGPLPPPIVEDLHYNDDEKRRCIALPDEDTCEMSYPLQSGDTTYPTANVIGNVNYRCDTSIEGNGKYRLPSNVTEAHVDPIKTDVSYRFDGHINDDAYKYDSNVKSSSLSRNKQYAGSGSNEGHLSSFRNNITGSSDFRAPAILEDFQQLGRIRSNSGDEFSVRMDNNHPPQHNMLMFGSL